MSNNGDKDPQGQAEDSNPETGKEEGEKGKIKINNPEKVDDGTSSSDAEVSEKDEPVAKEPSRTEPNPDELDDEPKKEEKIEINDNTFEQDAIFGDHNTINKNSYNYAQERNGLPTQLDPIDTDKIKFGVQDLSKESINSLHENSFLIVNCAHEEIANSLKHAIAQDKIFDTYKKQEVSFDTYESSDIIHLIEDCRRKSLVKKADKLLLFIYDSRNNKNPALLNSLRKKSRRGKDDIVKRLSLDFFIIYLTYHENQNYLIQSPFDFYIIDAFEVYMRKYKISEDQACIIRNDQKDDYWSSGDKNLLKDLDKIIEESNFNTIIRNKKNEVRTSFKEIFKNKKEPISKYVLFVATIFPELPPDLFNRYVTILIKDKKKIRVNDKKISLLSIWEEDTDSILDDCGLETYYVNNQSFVDFKNTNEADACKNTLFKKFTLFADQQARTFIEKQELFSTKISFQLHNRIHPVIAKLNIYFKNYYGEEILKIWLLKLENQRKNIAKYLSLEYNTETDIKILDERIDKLEKNKNIEDQEGYLRKMKEIDPINFNQQYDSKLKKAQYIKFLFYKEESLPENTSIKSILDELYELRIVCIDKLNTICADLYNASEILKDNTYLFVDLLAIIHENDESKELINKFFIDRFFEVNKHYIILNILTKFQIKNEVFNSLEFYKISLQHKTHKVNDYAIDEFISLLLKDPLNFYKYISGIRNWFPEITTSLEDYTRLEKNILTAYLLIITRQKKNDKYHSLNSQVIKSDVYKALFENLEESGNILEFIIENLFNAAILFEDKENTFRSRIIQYQLASIMSYWYSLLCRIEESEIPDTRIKEKKEILISILLKVLSKEQLKKLLLNLREIRLNQNKTASKIRDIKEKKKLKKKRGYLIELINQLKN
ncbi:hypothetical protein IMCC3317_17920 [Kordia antarctica]|uniref:Uncharacterized protein n=1 Tax=Kordia antarctica TaxID=1218801 RepID=A0A7L4ZJ26_9FLAO|nr:hypothetical protein [Kordia antarctica]QHI36429.1 hypothetical protein IMCC3317_17920 [Kordia antarctica]